MKTKCLSLIALIAVFFLWSPCLFSASSLKLQVGDRAPDLKPMLWLKGKPVTRFVPGQVYVIEYWATWCGGCVAAMPHLSELAQQYDGQVSFIGVGVRFEEETIEDLKQFVDHGRGRAMSYPVAIDYPAKRVGAGDTLPVMAGVTNDSLVNDWINGSGLYGLPATFIIDRRGVVAWIGRPDNLDTILPQILAGKFNPSLEEQNRETQLVAFRNEFARNAERLYQARKRKDYREMLDEADKLISHDQRNEPMVFVNRLIALLHINEGSGLMYARHKLENGHFQDLWKMMRGDATLTGVTGIVIAHQEGLSSEAYQFAATNLEKAAIQQPLAPSLWEGLGQARFQLQDFKGAVEAQTAAIRIATGFSKDTNLDRMKATLHKYKMGKTAQTK